MDQRLEGILEALLLNIATLNKEIHRMGRTEQFRPTPQSFQLLEHIRGNCTCTLQMLRTIERRLYQYQHTANTLKPADRTDIVVPLKPPL